MHLGACAGIECAEGFVEQKYARALGERLRDCQPLLHAARQGAGIFVAMRPEPHRLDQREALFDRLAPGPAKQARGEGALGEFVAEQDIAEHGEMRKHRVALEYDPSVGPRFGGKWLAVEQDAALRRPLLAEDQMQEGALAGP